jgi:hypothetical protein
MEARIFVDELEPFEPYLERGIFDGFLDERGEYHEAIGGCGCVLMCCVRADSFTQEFPETLVVVFTFAAQCVTHVRSCLEEPSYVHNELMMVAHCLLGLYGLRSALGYVSIHTA